MAVVIYYTAVSVFFDSLTYSFGTSYILNYWFSNVFGLSVIPAAIIIYNKVMKDKEQNSWPFFIALIITALMILSSAYDVIDSLRSIGYSIFYLFFSLIRTAITLFGCVHLAVGCIDFCQATTAAYDPNGDSSNQQEPEVKKEEPKGGETPPADQK